MAYFVQPLGDGYMKNPSTGEILDTNSGRVFASSQELRNYALQPQSSSLSSSGQGGAGLSSAISGLGTAGSSGASYLTGAGSTSAATSGATGVGSSITGGTMMSNGTIAPMTAGGPGVTASGTGSLAGIGTYALPAAAVIAGLAGGQDTIRRLTDGDQTSTDWRQAAASIPNAPVVGVYNAIGKPLGIKRDDAMRATMMLNPLTAPLAALDMMGIPVFGNNSRQSMERKARKEGRRTLQDMQLLNPDSRSTYSLADGTGINIQDYKKNTGKDFYNIDSSNLQNDADRVALANSIVNAGIGGNSKLRSDLAGEVYNAWNSNGKFDENARAKFDALGGRNAIYEAIAQKWKDSKGKMSANERDSSFAALDKFYGIANPNNQRWEDGAGLSQKEMERNRKELEKFNSSSPVQAGVNTSSMGGRPATPINANTYRPGASKNPNFKSKK